MNDSKRKFPELTLNEIKELKKLQKKHQEKGSEKKKKIEEDESLDDVSTSDSKIVMKSFDITNNSSMNSKTTLDKSNYDSFDNSNVSTSFHSRKKK